MNVSPWFEPSIGNLPSIMISTSISVSRRYSLHIKSSGGTKISRGIVTGYQPDRLDAHTGQPNRIIVLSDLLV
jgi:hypothetical protein